MSQIRQSEQMALARAMRLVADWMYVCQSCGQPHAMRPDPSFPNCVTWADPCDGHAYRPRELLGVPDRLLVAAGQLEAGR